ncbi:MAG: carbohydrate deacetylase [Alphaproteobacteria bacterium]|mgnify:FL=1|nr:ChbG/HpnK family deacetylase [Alphaproteobacteria bacterium]MDY4689165.1 ChbG/HpnK family deacetylase [Alphaproteobacteria bacterium]
MTIKKIFNADDFGISKGVNAAIVKAHREGILNSASLMINQKYADEAVKLAKEMPELEIGLHVNLTNEYPAAPAQKIPLLVDEHGKLKNGFVNLLLLSFLKPRQLRQQAETEMRAQIVKYLATGLPLQHLDSHRHVHMIPQIFKAMRKLQKEFEVPRIRVMNENALNTLKYNKNKSWLFDGALIKYVLLRFLCWWNGYKNDVYFYTLLYTCKIAKEQFKGVKIPSGYKAVEIMIHPGMPEIDRQYPQDVWDENILSPYRTVELETLLDKNVPENIND